VSLLTDRTPPRDGTKLAITYWAARTREAMRFAEAMLAEGDVDSATSWANDAAGCAGEFETACQSYAEANAR
jgi:hypothetical protein